MSMDAAAKKMPAGANAPYKIVPVGKKFAVKNNAGETKATFDDKGKAVDYLAALYANVKGAAKRAAKVPFTGTAKNRAPKTATAAEDLAHDLSGIPCYDENCTRSFLDFAKMADHAEAVHTFDDIRMIVSEGLREKYATKSDSYSTSVYIYIVDLADDWVVFEASKGGNDDYYKASYSIIDNVATFGALTEVRRRTLWEAVGANEPDGVLGNPSNLEA
ncbi:MAG: hypothetical protein HOV97_05135 [Nonomuraea sp.]|nr:hypothetical protein [Nonomuraea sp.]